MDQRRQAGGEEDEATVRRPTAEDMVTAAAERVTLRGRGAIASGSKTFHREQCQPKHRSARSINDCEPMDEPWRPTGRSDVQGSAQGSVSV